MSETNPSNPDFPTLHAGIRLPLFPVYKPDRPRLHLIRFHGVLAPNTKLRPDDHSERAGQRQYPLANHAEVPPPAAPALMS